MKHASKITSLEVAITKDSFSLAKLRKEKGEEFTADWVSLWLVYINQMLNLRRPMTEDMIELCATQIADEYRLLKVSDMALLTKRIINGEYGEFYESLSIAKVMTFFREYVDERFEHASSKSIQKHHDKMADLDNYNITRNEKRWYQGVSKLK